MKALPYFDVNAETTLQMDTSKKGLGACIIQKGKVVCYASRVLTKMEQNYQNLEIKALGTIWGMEKFHYFWYGKEFTLETEQMPLVSIYKKHMIDISPRVQRLIVRSFPYLPFKVVYKKGVDIPAADTLSRVTPMDPEDNINTGFLCDKKNLPTDLMNFGHTRKCYPLSQASLLVRPGS